MKASELLFLLASVLGGLGLFIYGMRIMTSGLEALAGSRLRRLLNRLTRRRDSGFVVGNALGVLVHSSAATVMLVGFLNAGLMTLVAAVPVMLGANVGTTLSMQLISFKLGKYCFFAIAIGLGMHLIARREGLKNAGLMFFGFGLLFLGMNTMSAAMGPLKQAGYFEAFLTHTDASTPLGLFLGILASTAVTGIIQSSGATIGMLFALANAGVFADLSNVFPLVLGAHVGTCATALLGSLGTNLEARRLALAHLLFNGLGVVLAALMASFYLWFIPQLGGDLMRQIANTHTAVQLLNAMIVLGMVPLFVRFVVWISPSRKPPEAKSFLDDAHLKMPETAIIAVILETRRMATIVRKMVRRAMAVLVKLDDSPVPVVHKDEASVDLLKESINQYLVRLSNRRLSRRQSIILQYLVRAAADTERIGDHAEDLLEITDEKAERGVWFDDDSMLRLIELYKQADRVLGLMIDSLDPSRESFDEPAEAVIEARRRYKKMSASARALYTQRVLAREDDATSGMVYEAYLTCLDRIVSHSKRIAQLETRPLFRVKKHKIGRAVDSPGRRAKLSPEDQHRLVVDTAIFHTDQLDKQTADDEKMLDPINGKHDD